MRLPFVITPVQNKEGVARPIIEDVSCQRQGACCPHWLLFLQPDESRFSTQALAAVHPILCGCGPARSFLLAPTKSYRGKGAKSLRGQLSLRVAAGLLSVLLH